MSVDDIEARESGEAVAAVPIEAQVAIIGIEEVAGLRGMPDPVVPRSLLSEPTFLEALAARDAAAIYGALGDRDLGRARLSQRKIAALTGQSQSEISEVMAGRRIVSHEVLARIADGLGIPRILMGLADAESVARLIVAEASGTATIMELMALRRIRSELGKSGLVGERTRPPVPAQRAEQLTAEDQRVKVTESSGRMHAVFMDTWTGADIRVLRQSLRLSVRQFADYVGVSDRMVSKWEADPGLEPRSGSQFALDAGLAGASDDAKLRFADAINGVVKEKK